jgi:hypothetical protein
MQVSVRLEVLDTCGRTDTLCGISELGVGSWDLINLVWQTCRCPSVQ